MLSAEIIRELRKDHAESDKDRFSDSLHFAQFIIFFRTLYIINIDYMHQLCFLYMLNYPAIYSLSERESGSKHAGNCIYLRKIENSF